MSKTSVNKKQPSRLRTLVGVLRRRDIVHGMTPEKLRLILEDMGPTYIKLGQIMSMRSDILPEIYCKELQDLRTKVRPVAFKEVKKVMEDEWGRSVSKIFEIIDETPLGSASIAQVYCARLKETEEDVVIKVQRPGVYEMMAQDTKLIHKALSILKVFGIGTDALDFGAVIDEMWTVAQQEMNFLLEAEHIERFSKFQEEISYVGCPKVYKNLTTAKVLVMERIKGCSIDNIDKLKELEYDMNEIGLKLAESYSKQVLDDAFFHADPHPGNIRISGGKIVFIDLGMMGTLSERDRTLIKSAIESLAAQDVHMLKDVVLTLGEPQDKVNHSELYSDLDKMVKKYLSLDIKDIDLGQLVTELLELAGGHKIRMPSTITMLARGILTIEGVLKYCSPNVNLLQIITAHIAGERFEDLSVKDELQKISRDSYSMIRKGMEIPVSLADLLKMTMNGEVKANLEIVGSDEPLKKIDNMVTRLIVCIFAASLLMGSSIICTTQMEPKLFQIPLIGALGFFVALIMGLWLLVDAILTKRRKKKRRR